MDEYDDKIGYNDGYAIVNVKTLSNVHQQWTNMTTRLDTLSNGFAIFVVRHTQIFKAVDKY